MVEDATLDVVLMPDESNLEDVQDELMLGVDDSGKSDGGGNGGVGELLASIGSKLAIVSGAITIIPGMLNGVMRLLEVALLPLTAWFASLLAPVLKKMLRFLVNNNVFQQISEFASRVVNKIASFIDAAMQIASEIQSMVSTIQSFFSVESTNAETTPGFNVPVTGSDRADPAVFAGDGPGPEPGSTPALNPNQQEFSLSTRDQTVKDQSRESVVTEN